MGWHSSKEKPQLLHLFNGDTTFIHLLQKGPSLLWLWGSGEVLPRGPRAVVPHPASLPLPELDTDLPTWLGWGWEGQEGGEEAHFLDKMGTGATQGLDSWTPEWAVTLASGDPALGPRVVGWASVAPSVSPPSSSAPAPFFCVAVGKAMSSLGLRAISKPGPSWFLTKQAGEGDSSSAETQACVGGPG